MAEIIIGNLPAPATTPLTGAERVPMDQRVGGVLAATALTPGLGYAIISLGSTNWTACGVPAGVTPAVGLVFTCSAVGTGTGTAQQVETVDAAASEIAALAPSTNLSYDPATRLLSSSTGTDVTLPLVTTQAPGLVPTLAGGTGSFLRADGTWASPPAGATDLSYDPATRLLASSTGADVTLPLAGPTTAGLLPPTNDPLSLASLTVTGTLTAPHIHGAMAGPLYIHVRNDAGVSLPAGSTVHVVGNQGDTSVMLVVLARADDPATMPANGILVETLAPNAEGHAIDVGELTGINTSGLTAGAQLFVALTGGLTITRPATNPQAIATVGRVHASTGSILVHASPVLSTVAFTGAYSDLTGRPSLATVATSGAYSDLTGRPPEISQADAEAGTAITFSLWSPQRWRQAAAAWWQTVTSAVGRSLVAADDAPAARSAISAAGSGAITSSGLTMAPARLLGRTTAGAGAVEEIQVSGGSFTGNVLTLFDPASPGAIGGTTPSGGTFTALTLPTQATSPAAPATGFRLFADASGRVSWRRGDGWTRTLEASGITGDRVWAFPDRSGTLALNGDVTLNSNLSQIFNLGGSLGQEITAVSPGVGLTRLVYWNPANNRYEFLSLGSNLSISSGILNATGGGAVLPGYGVGSIIIPYDAQVGIGAAMTANTIYLTPFAVKKSITSNQVAFRVTTNVASSSFQYAIYGSSDVLPTGSPIVSSGNLSAAAATVVSHSPSTPFTLLSNQIYWTAINTDINGVGLQTLAAACTNTLNLVGTDGAATPLSTSAHVIRQINSAPFGTWPDVTSATSSLQLATRGGIPQLRINSLL